MPVKFEMQRRYVAGNNAGRRAEVDRDEMCDRAAIGIGIYELEAQ